MEGGHFLPIICYMFLISPFVQPNGESASCSGASEVPRGAPNKGQSGAPSLTTTETVMPLIKVNFIFWKGFEIYFGRDVKGHIVLGGKSTSIFISVIRF